MRKMSWLGILLFLSLLVYGCTGQPQTAAATDIPTAVNTQAAVPATEIIAPTTAAAATEVVDCQPYTLLDEILSPASTNLLPITEDGDHILGPEGAKLVILDYSDFQ